MVGNEELQEMKSCLEKLHLVLINGFFLTELGFFKPLRLVV